MTGSAGSALDWVNSPLKVELGLSVKWRIFTAQYRVLEKKSSKIRICYQTPNGHFRQQFGHGEWLGSE
jgi:hypothetical protein